MESLLRPGVGARSAGWRQAYALFPMLEPPFLPAWLGAASKESTSVDCPLSFPLPPSLPTSHSPRHSHLTGKARHTSPCISYSSRCDSVHFCEALVAPSRGPGRPQRHSSRHALAVQGVPYDALATDNPPTKVTLTPQLAATTPVHPEGLCSSRLTLKP